VLLEHLGAEPDALCQGVKRAPAAELDVHQEPSAGSHLGRRGQLRMERHDLAVRRQVDIGSASAM
jgi:hypothetical protein